MDHEIRRLATFAQRLLPAVLAVSVGAEPAAAVAPAPPPAAPASRPISVIDGMTVVELSLAMQRRAGVQSQPLRLAAAPVGATTNGVVLDLQPLVVWASKLTGAEATAAAARAQAQAADADLARTRALYRDDQIVSLKSLQAAQSSAALATANARAAEAALKALRSEGRLTFGEAIASDIEHHAGLSLRDHAVIRVAMTSAGLAPRTVQVAYGSGQPAPARWLSRAPQADAQLGADVQLYEADRALPADASVVVHLPGAASVGQGIFVPLQAVVWYADQPWVYVQRDPTHFARVALIDAQEQPEGFFVPQGLRAGQQVVTRGAGLLLSQEQTPPPGSGSGCKDPECDD